MKIFTYEQYLEYKKQVKQYADTHFKLNLEKEIFLKTHEIKEQEDYKYYNYEKTIKNKLKLIDKKQIINIINKAIGEGLNLIPNMLQICNSNETNIIRIIKTNVYFIIEYAKKIDEITQVKLLKNMIKIMKTAEKNIDIRKYMKTPTVIPIIIYEENKKNNEENLYPFQKIGLGEYNTLIV